MLKGLVLVTTTLSRVRSFATIPRRYAFAQERRCDFVHSVPKRMGEITIENTQDIPIDEEGLRRWMRALLEGVRCEEFDVGLWLANEEHVRSLNLNFRSVDASTDILSFPFHDEAEPGAVPDTVPRDNEDLLNLGDMTIDVAYVRERMMEDKADLEDNIPIVDDTDKGVGRALAHTFNLERRLRMLLIHGVCHLLMYDHETDEDFAEMAALEDRLLARLADFEENEQRTSLKQIRTNTER